MHRINPYFEEEQNKDLLDLPPEIREAYIEVTQAHHKLLERLAQR